MQQHILQPKNINMKHLLIWAQKALFQRLAMAEASESIFFTFNFKLNCIWIKIWSKKTKKWNLIKSDQNLLFDQIWSGLIRFHFFEFLRFRPVSKKPKMKFVSKNGIVLKGFCNHKPVEKGFYVSKFQINIDVCPPQKRCVLLTCHENKQTHTHSKKTIMNLYKKYQTWILIYVQIVFWVQKKPN